MAKILILTPRFPYPIVAGDTLRIHHVCKELSKYHSLTLLSLCSSEDAMTEEGDRSVFDRVERVYHPTWRALLGTVKALFTGKPLQLGYYESPTFRKRLNHLLPSHDMVLAHLVRTGQYLETREENPVVLEMTDALFVNYRRVIETNSWGWKNLIYRFEQPRMEQYEREVVDQFDLVSLVSDIDREALLSGNSADKENSNSISVYTNGIDLENRPYSKPNPDDPPVLAFIGNMRTVHNQDTCHYLIQEVLPQIRRRLPETELRVIGNAKERDIRALERHEGVEVTGWVDSIPKAARGALCGIGVMRMGAGLQNKILEYMALGLPVIANERGLEGIQAEPSRHVLLGSNPQEITDHVIRLASDHNERMRLSRAGRRFVEANHRWSKALQPMVEDINMMLSDHS
ncbi:glycosyltransferase family 4 protein [Salinibacter ruber]|uniref:glycosyltransferase family 4 protein n=1 Tax=Salinibacter ruber TaxID=146919 RepID=UPI0021693590|nr:glycosyltransferase family 4 protein [Salinibacter ruber]MCS3648566.1 glycosyltransferase involved in cell wall biosynthesis [Salinibacter ruber]